MIAEEPEWPPTYQLKRHARARGVKFIISPTRGLQITVPPRFNLKQLPAIIEEHKAWILKNTIFHPPLMMPTEILQMSVHYFPSSKPLRIRLLPAVIASAAKQSRDFKTPGLFRYAHNDETLTVSGNLTCWREKLTLWVRKFAAKKITAYFYQLSLELGLPFRDLSIRSQATLWGSCSPDKSIRLNYKLIFLPEALMRHIMIHELCHTRYMNHSSDFWQLVASFDANWREHRRAMKKADHYIPRWIIN